MLVLLIVVAIVAVFIAVIVWGPKISVWMMQRQVDTFLGTNKKDKESEQ